MLYLFTVWAQGNKVLNWQYISKAERNICSKQIKKTSDILYKFSLNVVERLNCGLIKPKSFDYLSEEHSKELFPVSDLQI